MARSPALHFVALGAVLFLLQTLLDGAGTAPSEPAVTPEIVLDAEDVAQIVERWRQETGALPDATTRARLVEDAIEEEILVREAMAAGLPRRERVVRERLVQLAEFLEASGQDAGDLEARARGLGLERTDPVIRRHLAQTMRLLLSRAQPSDVPDDAELEEYLAAHAETYRLPATLRLTHVHLADAGPEGEREAAGILARLRAGEANIERAPDLGDPFASGGHLGPASEARLRALLGEDLVAALSGLPVGAWSEPLRSAYGWHLVWIHEREPARLPELDAVRSRLIHQLLRERRRERLAQGLERLARRYEIRVELPDA